MEGFNNKVGELAFRSMKTPRIRSYASQHAVYALSGKRVSASQVRYALKVPCSAKLAALRRMKLPNWHISMAVRREKARNRLARGRYPSCRRPNYIPHRPGITVTQARNRRGMMFAPSFYALRHELPVQMKRTGRFVRIKRVSSHEGGRSSADLAHHRVVRATGRPSPERPVVSRSGCKAKAGKAR